MARPLLLASVAVLLPMAARAQQPVPAIQATAAAQASVATAPQTRPTTQQMQGTVAVPAGDPPPVHQLAPSAPLNAKEKASVAVASRWRLRPDKPSPGEDGVVRWVYGSSQPVVVCAPLQVCDIAFQPGEIINSVNVGDKDRWMPRPGLTGSGADRVSHINVKPTDADLVSSMIVYTNKRTYSIKLIANAHQYTPFTGFTYPDDVQTAWAQYAQQVAVSDPTAPRSPMQVVQQQNAPAAAAQQPTQLGWHPELSHEPVQQAAFQQPVAPPPPPPPEYSISGDNVSFRPVRVYTENGRTYVQFAHAMQFSTAPAILGLASDGFWFFSSPTQQMLVYRFIGNDAVIDGIVDHAELVLGVGSASQKVEFRRINQ
jgi:type IV secretion system protein TrbG